MTRPLLFLLAPALLLLAPFTTADPIAVLDTACSPNAQIHAYTFAGGVDLGPAVEPWGDFDPTGERFGLLDFGAVQVFDGATGCAGQPGGSVSLCTQENPNCCGKDTGISCCVAMAPGVFAGVLDPCDGSIPTDPCSEDILLCCEWDSPPPCPPPCEVCIGDGDREAGIGGGFFPGTHHGNVFEVVGNVVAYPLLQKYPPFIVGSDGDGDGLITDRAPDCRERAPGNQGSFVTSCPVGVDGGRWVLVLETYRPDPEARLDLENPLQSTFPLVLEGAPAGFVRTSPGYP